ncbi:MAG TPA: hypothetical protein VFH78_00500 [Candidatus Thermoplasmatota archaeon]|nr:hypothetical protein [Candidatus Thermoplasmatota archaeon]
MPSEWSQWDARVRQAGRAELLVGALTDAEIVNLLASDERGRTAEKRLLKDEAFRRMTRAQADKRIAELLGRPQEKDARART